MSSLLKISVSLVLLFLHLTASGEIPSGIQAGAAEAGMSYACTVREGFWSSFRNQALLAFNTSFSCGISYENRFGIKELGTRTIGAIIPAGKASAGLAYSNFGYPDFRRNTVAIACGLKLSEKIAAGVQIDYFSERTYGEYDNRQCITFETGIIVSPSENVRFGFHLFNPVPNSLRKDNQPASLTTGAGIMLGQSLLRGSGS